jgi:leucine dehydrogenase
MTVFDHPDFRGHERVVFSTDRASGLRAIIAIHSTVLGDAAGGVRCLPYARPAFALHDALQLARAMTLRSALAGVPLGGAQAVIIADPLIDKTEQLLAAFGRATEMLDGTYTCAPDLGMTPEDMAAIGRSTRHVIGLPGGEYDVPEAAAYGLYQAIRAAALARLGPTDLAGLRVVIHGLGKFGLQLCGHLCEAGATLLVADPDAQAVRGAVAVFGATAVPCRDALSCAADVLVPCVTGTVLNEDMVGEVQAPVICGLHLGLAGAATGRALQERGILAVPDTVAGAGAAIGMAAAMLGEAEPVTRRKLEGMFDVCLRILERARVNRVTPAEAADRFAEALLQGRHEASAHHRERAVA